MKNKSFSAEDILYVGLQKIHDYQRTCLDRVGMNYKIQTEASVSLDLFRQSGSRSRRCRGGRMTMEQVGHVLSIAEESSDVVGFTIAEYLPLDEYRLHQMLSKLRIFQ